METVTKSTTWQERFVANLDAAISFHAHLQSDPYDTANAVILALTEVKTAFVDAQKQESGWKS